MRTLIFVLLFSVISTGGMADVKLQRIGGTLFHPWGLSLLNNTEALVTERRGKLFRINLTTGEHSEISNAPKAFTERQGGLLDILVHNPDTTRPDVYFCYSRHTSKGAATAVNKAVLDGNALVQQDVIFTANNSSWKSVHFGCRLAIPRTGSQAGYLFASLGDRGDRDNAQDPAHHAGSIIRLHPDGRVPDDNPKHDGWAPEIWSIGHRNPQGMTTDPLTGTIWTHEHGPRGGDEINRITGGENYGWPTVSHGREYATGMRVSKHKSLAGYADPEWVWDPSIAPSGMAFYPHEATMFDAFAGHMLIGSLKFRQLYLVRMANGTPMDERIVIDGKGGDGIGRIRDVAIAPDGSILLLNDEASGGLYRFSQ